MKNESKMHFLEHLEELRKRIIFSLISIVIFFVPSYFFSKEIFDFLMTPIIKSLPEGSSLIFIRPAEGFLTYLKVAIFASFCCSFPVILYQIWSFISPGLYKKEKNIVIPFIFFGTTFFLCGAFFCYSIAAPQGFKFLLGEYTTEYVKAFPSIKEALSFLMSLMIGFGLIFEFPLIIFILSRLGIVTSTFLRNNRKYSFLISAIAAAFITPTTDAISMMFMLIPLFIFYEIGIVVALIFGKEKTKNELPQEPEIFE
ncbi:MAG: twin-arginine translocase subunit TatC [Candidatus Dadabacteria bacterium]|nr:twin-arginine translocase subunit TatC [Candidatus Dadabacteria bacterium]NIQ12933.1 twin-arginine translocase subunit TatC [Candidatus Dadabacteria bacterium]